MFAKYHETKRAVFKSHIDHLEKQFKDRDVHDLEGFHKESEVYKARVSKKLKKAKQECELRMNKERKETRLSTTT